MAARKKNTLEQARKLAAKAQQVRSGGRNDGLVGVGLRLTPEVVEQLGLVSTLRKAAGEPAWSRQAVADEALAAFLPGEIDRLVKQAESEG